MLVYAFVLFFFAIGILIFARRSRIKSGLPGGKVTYTDMRGWEKVHQPLFDPSTRLTGRPDYLVREGDHITPVEVKSSHVGNSPYDGHIYQLLAYCLLVEVEYGIRPAHGILHYPNKTFSIDYTSSMESELLFLMEDMRSHERQFEVNRSHDSQNRCRGCGYGSQCTENLTNY